MKNTPKSQRLQTKKGASSKMQNFTLFESSNELDKLSIEQKFILENQNRDLKKASKQKLSIELFARELVFFDLLIKENKVNKKILELDILKKKDKLCKSFINEFYYINTPNEKNYEKQLIEKLTNKIILEYIENSYTGLDKKDLEQIKNTIEKLENLKEDFRKIGFKNINDIEKQKEQVKEYRKTYQKEIQKQLKSRYRLAKKYKFLID